MRLKIASVEKQRKATILGCSQVGCPEKYSISKTFGTQMQNH
jgi:hypothetical protein